MSAFSRITLALAFSSLAACGPSGPSADVGSEPVEPSAAELRSVAPLRVPAPTGPYAVGVRRSFVRDDSRIEPKTSAPRALPTWVYYPAHADRAGHAAPYLAPAVQSYLEAQLGLPPRALEVKQSVREGALPLAHYRGVVLASGGWGTAVAFDTALISELASFGWVVVAFDHPHDTFLVEQPDASTIEGLEVRGELAFSARVADFSCVLEQLPALVPGLRASTPVGAFGHSLGGAAALEALGIHSRLRAAVDLDGTPRGEIVERGTAKPVGVLSSNTFLRETGAPDRILMTLLSRLRGPAVHRNMYELAHYGFTDFVLLNPQAAARDATLGATLEDAFTTDSADAAEGRWAIAEQRRFLVEFMARFVR